MVEKAGPAAGVPSFPWSLTLDSSSADQRRLGNSRNHQFAGQNVRYGDGHCEFRGTPFCTPFCGYLNANIYTAAAVDANNRPLPNQASRNPLMAQATPSTAICADRL